jgi:hypothetical protein|tara:strand:+ start:315 stop:479 length:165 start_codon:yes stop_codon:yes gene_type:complete
MNFQSLIKALSLVAVFAFLGLFTGGRGFGIDWSWFFPLLIVVGIAIAIHNILDN